MTEEQKKRSYDAIIDSIKDSKSNTEMVHDKIVEMWDDLCERYPSRNATDKAKHIGRYIGDTMRLDDPKRFENQEAMTYQNVIYVLKQRGVWSTEKEDEQ